MGKNKNNQKTNKNMLTIKKISDSRTGGQVALRGYTYQFLYSCYLILLSTNDNTIFHLEGIEDIDRIRQEDGLNDISHIQLKYSENRQDASFLKDVLKNFLEVYLLDQTRSFKLVYDFNVARGNLSKLFEGNLDNTSREYWENKIAEIQRENTSWDWSAFDFNNFISKLSFENVKKTNLEAEVEKILIQKYYITTNNIVLFANSVKILCLEKMAERGCVTKKDIDNCIEAVKFDISKGAKNPAHSWIRRLDFSVHVSDKDMSYYEGKKATVADIVKGLPIQRPQLEKDIINTIKKTTITVIKSSSGQGKTTLALRASYELQSEYVIYQLNLCDDLNELGHITDYFKSRIRLGEKIIILIDNLDAHLGCWNSLAQMMQTELPYHYRMLITARENDWYNYRGDISNIHSIKVIKPVLNDKEAKEIFNTFEKINMIHPEIKDWRRAWNKIADRQLLIEYVYLITHGEMLSERISVQMSEIGKSEFGRIKCEILRKVCFADICGIKLSVNSLYSNISEHCEYDYGEMLRSMEEEFLVRTSGNGIFIEGLHPIRSKHIVDNLHEFSLIDETAISVIKMAQSADIPGLFSHLPEFDLRRKEIYCRAADLLIEKSLADCYTALQGLFSGSVMRYYRENRTYFDDANAHGGLFLISTEICPFTKFDDFGVYIDTLDDMKKILPNNPNLKYLSELRDSIPMIKLEESDVYILCNSMHEKICSLDFSDIQDYDSFAKILEWIYNINPALDFSTIIPIESIWISPERFSIDCISSLMYTSFCANREMYSHFVKNNFSMIITYLKHKTHSHLLYVDEEEKSIHVEYILRLSDIEKANEESVTRLKFICKALPIFEHYCSDAIKPTVKMLSAYPLPNDSHKRMPIRNVIITFRQDIASLWNNTIKSNYEFDTLEEWVEYWVNARECVYTLEEKFCEFILKKLENKFSNNLVDETEILREKLTQFVISEATYPKESRLFDQQHDSHEGFNKANNYFQSINNFSNQFVSFMLRKADGKRLAPFNLKAARSNLNDMQNYYGKFILDPMLYYKHLALCVNEQNAINLLIMLCSYYDEHQSPIKNINKHQVREWYEEQCKNELETAENALQNLQFAFSVHFPRAIFYDELLSSYPIVIDNLDLALDNEMMKWFMNCIPFANSSFDYLITILANGNRQVHPTAFKIPRQMLRNVQEAMELDDISFFEKIIPPYPVEVTSQMLECFEEKYEMPTNDKDLSLKIPIGDIAEELWVFSKTRTLLTSSEDNEYLKSSLNEIHTNILEMLNSIGSNLSKEYFNEISNLCTRVFNGESFDNDEFNTLIENYITMHKELFS